MKEPLKCKSCGSVLEVIEIEYGESEYYEWNDDSGKYVRVSPFCGEEKYKCPDCGEEVEEEFEVE